MQDITEVIAPGTDLDSSSHHRADRSQDVVSTHVLVPDEQAERLRVLSRKTRVAQSEYLREAVDDLLGKYGKRVSEEVP